MFKFLSEWKTRRAERKRAQAMIAKAEAMKAELIAEAEERKRDADALRYAGEYIGLSDSAISVVQRLQELRREQAAAACERLPLIDPNDDPNGVL